MLKWSVEMIDAFGDTEVILMVKLHSHFLSWLTLFAHFDRRSYIEADPAAWSGGTYVFWNHS